MDFMAPELRPAKLLLWSMAAALLRGDERAAAVLAIDAPEPTMTVVAAESLAEVLRIYSRDTGLSALATQQWVMAVLAKLTLDPGPDPRVDARVQHLGQPGWLPSS